MGRERGGKSGDRSAGDPATPDATRGARRRARARTHEVPPDAHAAPGGEAGKSGERAPALGDLLRKAVAAGLTGVFGPTEAVRRAVGEAMPRDWIDFAAEQSERTRSQFLERLAQELAHTLETIDLVQIAERVLEGRTIELRAQIRLAPREADDAASARDERSGRAPFRFLVVDGDKEE